MKILLLGRDGQLGWELQRALAPLGRVIGLGRSAQHNPDALCGDLDDLEGLARTVRTLHPQLIVNAAAYTAVDKAEAEPEKAFRINAEAPGVLAEEAHRCGAWLQHYSSDYVFDGSGDRPWKEGDATGPLNTYGSSKLAGEKAVSSYPRHVIFRTSWVYAARGAHFAKTILQLAAERDHLRVVNDQFGAPTSAEMLADVSAHALRCAMQSPELAGTYHCAAAGETSWWAYARWTIETASRLGWNVRATPDTVTAIATTDYPTPARRPMNSRLNTDQLQSAFGVYLDDWRTGAERMLREIQP